jgi:hypothetical protein
MTINTQTKTRIRRAAIAILLAAGSGGAPLTIPPAALAYPGNPETPTGRCPPRHGS